MEPEEKETLDKQTIKALSVDTRLGIMKQLASRRKLPSELSKSMKLAPSTVVEHLKVLETAGIVKKKPHGPKWVYYELTRKGENIVEPETPVRFMFGLFCGLGLMFLGGITIVTSGFYNVGSNILAAAPTAVESSKELMAGADTTMAELLGTDVPASTAAAPLDWLFWIFLIVGIILFAASLYMLKKR